MHWTIYIFGSGLAFFVAVALLLLAVIPSIAGSSRTRLRILSAIVGAIFLAVSAAPLSLFWYVATSISLLFWLATLGSRSAKWQCAHAIVATLTLIMLVAGIGKELKFRSPPRLKQASSRHVDLFGDSLAAGISDGLDSPWPELLASGHDLELVNHATPGAKLATAIAKARQTHLADGLVLVEIGGNDLLDGVSVREFERDLDELLSIVSGSGRQVVMFELPLPPLHNGFGLAQRRQAAKHGAQLIPNRVLMGVLATDGATIDSLHLTPAGHQQLADAIWKELEPAYDDQP